MQDLQSKKNQLNDKLATLSGNELLNPSDFKFMGLLWSRLCEEGVPVDHAGLICSMVDFDMSAVNEDDDYIGDVALKYAEYCGKVYTKLKQLGVHRFITANSSFYKNAFNPIGKVIV